MHNAGPFPLFGITIEREREGQREKETEIEMEIERKEYLEHLRCLKRAKKEHTGTSH